MFNCVKLIGYILNNLITPWFVKDHWSNKFTVVIARLVVGLIRRVYLKTQIVSGNFEGSLIHPVLLPANIQYMVFVT